MCHFSNSRIDEIPTGQLAITLLYFAAAVSSSALRKEDEKNFADDHGDLGRTRETEWFSPGIIFISHSHSAANIPA